MGYDVRNVYCDKRLNQYFENKTESDLQVDCLPIYAAMQHNSNGPVKDAGFCDL